MNIITICLLSLWTASVHAGIDSLFNQKATIEDLLKTSEELDKTDNKPLPVDHAIAELCYELDLCAQSSEKMIPAMIKVCEDMGKNEAVVEDEMNYYQPECLAHDFKSKYSCSPDVKKQDAHSLGKSIRLLDDYSSTYKDLFSEKILKCHYTTKYPELKKIIDDTQAVLAYVEKNPDLKATIQEDQNSRDKFNPVSVHLYTKDCYQQINKMLYTNDAQKIQRYFNLLIALKKNLLYFPEHKGKVNRGVRLPLKALEPHLITNNVVCYESFTSTAIHFPEDLTSDHKNGFLGDPCGQRMFINYEENGAKAGRLIDKMSASEGENEVLFEPGSCFRINNFTKREKPPTASCDTDVYDFDMTLVPKP